MTLFSGASGLKTLSLFTSFVLLGGTACADQIFRISFSGTMIQGATGRLLQSGDTFAQVDLTGAKISGFLDYNLSLAPMPTISGTTTRADSPTQPWITGSVAISGYSLPSTALPVPQLFSIKENPAPPGAMTHGTPAISESLVYARNPNQGPEAILSIANFLDAWASDQQFEAVDSFVGLDLSSSTEFDTSPNGFPVPFVFTSPVPGVTSIITLNGLFQDPRNVTSLPLHGVTAQYQINGRFANDSAQGAFMTPEPATIGLVGFLLVVGALAGRRIRPDERQLTSQTA
jgi:hypothetical protein